MLKSIEISGFKSFGKRAKLDFKTPISAIVGPNGSGKSNVAEAFRFALGEQSMKSLRGKKTEDLIFNGSSGGNRSNRASVRVILDNSKKPLGIEFDEVVLERVVHRDATHEYKINDSKVRRKDIVELLANANIGSTGHHIISQGEADRILRVSPEERREMIEDALGLKIYHYKKKESLRKLNRTEQNLKEVESLRKEIKPHLKFLKRQVGKVEKAKEQRDELVDLYKIYFAYEQKYISSNSALVEGQMVVPRGELKEIELEIGRLRDVLDSVKTESEFTKILLKLDQGLRDLQNTRNTLTRDLGRVEGELEARELVSEKHANTSFDSVPYEKVKGLYGEIEKMTEEVEASEDVSFLKNALKNISEKIGSLLQEFSNNEKAPETDDLEMLREKKNVMQREIDSLDIQKTDLLGQQADLQQKAEKERESFYVAERDLFKVLSRQSELKNKLEKLEDKKKDLSFRKESVEKELVKARMLFGRDAVDYDSVEVVGDESDQRVRLNDIERLKIKLEDSGLGSYGELKKEYDEVTERDIFFEKEISDLSNTKISLERMIKDIDIELDNRFKGGLNNINTQFKEFFSLMFGGGDASLEMVKLKKKKSVNDSLGDSALDEEELVKEGIEINVNLPKKRIHGLEMLSGGERALTSIALLFALSQINPPPFIILDETDAALDEANSRRYGDMIENLSKYSQLILITHNRETMSRAGLLYGVTMRDDGISKLLSIEFDEAVKVAK